MAESIPEELLGMICDEAEHPPDDGNVAWRKYQKNRSVLSLSQVCRTWRSHLTNNAMLWTDIAFDVSEARSIKLAGLFLEMIKVGRSALRIRRVRGDLRSENHCSTHQTSSSYTPHKTFPDHWKR
jgi:hypothetical protein